MIFMREINYISMIFISNFWLRLNAAVRFGLLVTVSTFALTGCWGGQKSVEMGPVEVTEAFCKAVAAGEWTAAESLCDTLSMGDYLMSHKEAWSKMEKEEGDAMEIVKSIMAKTTVSVKESHKADDKRIVTFTLETDGHSKTKMVTVAKVEGAWRVEGITEAN